MDDDRAHVGWADRHRQTDAASPVGADDQADDRHRLADAVHVLHGPGGDSTVRSLLYAVYLTALFGGIYGFTLVRGVVVTLGPDAWVLRHPLFAVGGLATVATALVAAAGWVGRVRGPVTPPLPWLDLVVTSSVDRALTLRAAWRMPSSVLVLVGAVLGPLLGAGLWAGGGAPVVVVPVAAVVGAVTGAAVAWCWLRGQVRSSASVRGARRPSTLLRRLDVGTVREHSVRSSRLGGGVLAGDARVIRLEAARPTRRGRDRRLRSRGRRLTVVTRDLLGLRRRPGRLTGGAVLVTAGTTGIAPALGRPDGGGLALAVCGLLCCHLGTGWWADGLRLLGDSIGTPRLLGGSVRSEAVAHSVVPAALTVAVVTATVTASTAVGGSSQAWVLVAFLPTVLVMVQWRAAFRSAPPSTIQLPEAGPVVLSLWWVGPALTTAVLGAVVVARPAEPGVDRWMTAALVLIGAMWWGGRTLERAVATARI
ncbi:MAG: hypothetical protein ACRCYR_15530 [Phycicoccus sp.]